MKRSLINYPRIEECISGVPSDQIKKIKNKRMKRACSYIPLIVCILAFTMTSEAQTLDVSVIRQTGTNKVQFVATATGAGFAAIPNNSWASMNLTWRIAKSATTPPPTSNPPTASPEITDEATAFTGAEPRDAFNNSLDLTVFDLTSFGEADDGYWYFQVVGTVETVQSISSGQQVVLYELTVPITWQSPGAVELLTTEVPELLAHGISTTSNVYNGGTGTDVLQVVVNNTPLPVQWSYVKAAPKDNNSILVSWGTESEQNNAGFDVERSENGVSFTAIGHVNGHGTSATPHHYTFQDRNVTSGLRYFYRIRQTDLDGRERYSVIVNATLLNGDSFIMEVNPNPVRNILNITLQSSRKQLAQLVIMDMSGKVFNMERSIQLETIATKYSTRVAGYAPGVYIARLITADGMVRSVKFVISR